MKPKTNFFAPEFKLEVIQEYLSGDLSQRDLIKKYNLSGGSQLTQWMRKFGFTTPHSQRVSKPLNMPKQMEKTLRELELEVQNMELQKQLELERLRTLALSTLIDVAERDLKIAIRKKPGTKQ
jgi:transposase